MFARGAALFVLLGFAAGCMMGQGMMGHRDERLPRVYSELRSREDAHHAAALRLAEPAAVREDTDRYAEDMHALMDGMMEVCADMMGSGMMGRGDYDGFRGMADRMNAAVDDHRRETDSLTDLEAMRAECEEHHRSMDEMLQEMGGMMPGGMMGGGMM